MGCGTNLVKLMLFVANFTVWAASLCLIGFGIYMLIQSARFDSVFAEDNMNQVAALVLALGTMGFLVGFSGCCGAIRENMCLLRMYFIFLLLIVLGEIAAGVMTFVYREDIEQSMAGGMSDAILNDYGVYTAATESIDRVQMKFECCGAAGFGDYDESEFRKENGPSSLPFSCCSLDESLPCYNFSYQMHIQGCVESSKDFLRDNILIFGLICFGFVILEILAMVSACCLITAVKRDFNYPFAQFA